MNHQILQLLQNPQMFQQKLNEFQQNFQQKFGNMSPQQMVQKLLNEGQMSQSQFNTLRGLANQITGAKN